MITILVDHNIEGHAHLLWSIISRSGWSELIGLRFVQFREIGLANTSSDRVVWRYAQTHQMYLLTDNRNMERSDSLEATIQAENTPTSLPVITIGRVVRLTEKDYRDACVARLLEIVLYPEDYGGAGRLFIP